MATTRRPLAPKPRTITDVSTDLEGTLARFQQERNLFQRLIAEAGGQLDYGLQRVVLERIHADEMAAREAAALEVRAILTKTEP